MQDSAKVSELCPKMRLIVGEKTINALIDTGATRSFVSERFVKENNIGTIPYTAKVFLAAGCDFVSKKCEISCVNEDNKKVYKLELLVLNGLKETMIIGMDYIQIYGIDVSQYCFEDLKKKNLNEPTISLLSIDDDPQKLEEESPVEFPVIGNDKICKEVKDAVKQLCMSVEGLWKQQPRELKVDIEHEIELKKDFVMQKCPIYKRSMSEHEIISQEVHKFLQLGYIEKCRTRYISPVVLVKKANGDIRFCVDYRRLK